MLFGLQPHSLDLSTGALPQWHDLVDEPVADNLAFDLTEDLRIFRALALLNGKRAPEMPNPQPDFPTVTSVMKMKECSTYTDVGHIESHLVPRQRGTAFFSTMNFTVR
jgi:hypothetical protein